MMDTLVERGTRERSRTGRSYSGGIECASSASTSYGSFSPSHGQAVGTPSISEKRSDREKNLKTEKLGHQRRRSSASPSHWTSTENLEQNECGQSSSHGKKNLEAKSTSQKQARKKHKGRHTLASKVCLNQKFIDALPGESEVSGDEDLNYMSNYKTFERLVQRSELEEEVFMLRKRLEEELELRAVFESALEQAPGTLTSFPRHLPISTQELLADIAVLEVAVLKLEEQTATLQRELGQAHTEREIAELRHASKHSMRVQGPLLHPTFLDSNNVTSEDIQTSGSPVRISHSKEQGQKLLVAPSLIEEIAQPPHSHGDLCISSLGDESDQCEQAPNTWKQEQQALTLRQDLRLTIPDVIDVNHTSLSPWQGKFCPLKAPWNHNPLEEEDHWIPLHEHHPQAMFATEDLDCHEGPCLLQSANGEAYEEDPPCFSPALIAETLLHQSRNPTKAAAAAETEAEAEAEAVAVVEAEAEAEAAVVVVEAEAEAEADSRSFLPVAEVLWKPSSVKPSGLSEQMEMEVPRAITSPARQPDSWSFTSEDGHPRPESGSFPHSMNFEDQPWAQLAESSVDEQRLKYRIGVLKVRAERRQGTKDKQADRLKQMGSLEASSISSIKSGVPLSPIWSPVDARAESEYFWGSQESINREGDAHDSHSVTQSPNELSEQMVRCMINIYRHLVDPNNTRIGLSQSGDIPSPTSPFGALANSSASSLSESSLLSITRSPLVDLRRKEEVLGTDATPDPYKARGKVPWAEIGPYARALEVPWLSVGKDQLEYAAQALGSFRLLVEELAKVDPSELKHDEKLVFWINLYNALLMHAYLAYGIPRSDLKFFALLQKAAYTVGGHSFNAATIEFCLLKSKSTAHRPQLARLMALHKNKLTESQSQFAIDKPEPLTSFALSSGIWSSPMVRIYTPKHVHSQLEDALQDYTRASVGISPKGRLLIPKLLYTYARENVEDSDILDWVCNLLPSNQVAVVFDCIQQRRHHILTSRNFNIIPLDFTFRYLFPAEVGLKKIF